MVIWRLTDGKPGHDRQSAGLAAALRDLTDANVHSFDVSSLRATLWRYWRRDVPFGGDAPDPELIVGAGRHTQAWMLLARRARGGKAVVLMRPQWPMRCFDLCVVPRHDRIPAGERVLVSEGVLNDIPPGCAQGDEGLILIGGPSKHHRWDETAVVQQIETVLRDAHGKRWTITNSRRTPASTVVMLRELADEYVRYVDYQDCPGKWLQDTLTQSDTVWISSDSVSMIYEALTAGARTGVLNVPAARDDRVSRIADDLAARGFVMTTDSSDAAAGQLAGPLNEAGRCGRAILERLFAER